MKLKVNKAALVDAIQKVQSVVPSRGTVPILSNVLLRATEGRLQLMTTDLEIAVRCDMAAEVAKEGVSTLPMRRIASIVRELPAQEIDLEIDDQAMAVIQSGASYFKIVGISAAEFPALPDLAGAHSYALDQGVLKSMLQKTGYAGSSDETRPVLNGVLFSFRDGKLTLVATDGRRLALVEQEVDFPESAKADIILPSKTVNELLKTLKDEGVVKIRATANQAAFEFDDILMVSKLIEGVYPNFRQVIPAESEIHVNIEREALLDAVRRVALVTSDQSNSIKLSFQKNKLEITTESPDVGEARETVAIQYNGKKVTTAFNPEFLMDPLRNLQSDEVIMELTDELNPGVIKCEVPFIYVLMPIRVS